MNAHKEAFLARQSGAPAMKDGLIETAGLPGDEEVEETFDEVQQYEDPAAANEAEEPTEEAPDTIQALDDMTVAELKDLADARGLDFEAHIKKADLVELLASS